MPSEIYLVGSKPHDGVKTLIVSQILHLAPRFSLEGVDAILFTSKHAIEAIDHLDIRWREIPALVIGQESARAVTARGGKVALISKSGRGDGFAREICAQVAAKRILYARAKEVASDIAKSLSECGIEVVEAIFYENTHQILPKECAPLSGAILIFAAPSAFRHFLMSFPWKASYQAIAIGETTLEAIKAAGVERVSLSPHKSIASCLKLAKFLANGR